MVGTVISLDQKNAYIDIGAKTAAVLPKEEMSIAKIDKVMPRWLQPVPACLCGWLPGLPEPVPC